MKKYLRLLFLPVLTGLSLCSAGQDSGDTVLSAHEQKLKWFADARFGMFIHWDMSSVQGTEISWSRKATKPLDITGDPAGYVEDTLYDRLYKEFNPVKFDATAWVKLARKAGMKYLVFTAKHHGGFCMWNTKYTDYNIMHTALHRDVLKELAEACHREGLGFGIYYSPRDWHHPGYGVGDNREYLAYMNGQLSELLSNYGKVDILWFDSYGMGEGHDDAFWHIGETYSLIKKLQPEVIINNRLQTIGDKHPLIPGDWDTPEQEIGKFQNNRRWESCLSVVKTADGGGWSYRPDGQVRSFSECIGALAGCATGDGNLLLDVGPDATGLIPAGQAGRLLQMGQWLNKFGSSIYGTRAGPFANGAWGGATYKGNRIYLHIVRWQGDKIILPKLKQTITSVSSLTNHPKDIRMETDSNSFSISLSESLQKTPETIVVLTLEGDAGSEMPAGKPLIVN